MTIGQRNLSRLWIWTWAFFYLAMSAACLTLAGCAVKGSIYQPGLPPTDKASIYVYRTYPMAGIAAAMKAPVTCANQSVTLGPGGYYRFEVGPGDILCSSRTENTAQVQFSAQVGQEYYVRQTLSMGILIAHVYLEQTQAEAAQADLKTCKLQ